MEKEIKTSPATTKDVILAPFLMFVVAFLIVGIFIPDRFELLGILVFLIINSLPLGYLLHNIQLKLKLYILFIYLIPLYHVIVFVRGYMS